MSWIWTTPGGWLVRSVVGGGVLLLVTWVLMKRTRQPARRQRLGEWGLGGAMLLAILNLLPAWIPVVGIAGKEPAGLRPAAKQQPPSPPLSFENPRKERGASFAQLSPEALDGQIGHESHGPMDSMDGEATGSGLNFPLQDQPEGNREAKNLQHRRAIEDSHQTTHKNADFFSDAIGSGQATAGAATDKASPLSVFLSLEVIIPVTCSAYAIGAAFLVGRWLLGYLALQRLLRESTPAPPSVRRLFAEVAGRGRRPRLLVTSRLRVPLSCGTLRPTIVLPTSLAQSGDRARLRWVLAHELTHLRRHDAWSCLLFGLGQGLYFFWPWFWWLRRQVRLCQEYIADAAVVRMVGSAEDYAEFLLSMTTASAVPVSATGVVGNSSDLFRRVTMLLKTPKRMERTVSWRWTLATAGGLLALAILVSGVGPRASASAGLDNVKQGAASADKTTPKDEQDVPKAPPQPQPPGAPPFGGFEFDDNGNPKAMMQRMQAMMGGRFGSSHGRLGVRVSTPSPALADQLDLPKDQGLVIDQVTPESPAAKGGLKNNDILLEFNGKPVPTNPGEFIRQVHEIKADAKVDAVVLRKGKKETIKGLALPEEKQVGFGGFAPPQGGFPQFGGAQGQGGFGPAPGGAGFGGGFGGKPFPAPDGMMMGFGGANTVMTTITRTNERFTTRHQEGSLVITVTGTIADGTSKASKIHVQDGQVAHDYESVDKVPDQYKDKVKNLVEMSEKGSVKIEIKTPETKPDAKPEAKPEAK